MPRKVWTEERVDKIEQARAAGVSFGEIARTLGARRNAVIGALRRRTHPDVRVGRTYTGDGIYTVGFYFSMEREMHAALKAHSTKTGVPMAELVRTAIEWMLENDG